MSRKLVSTSDIDGRAPIMEDSRVTVSSHSAANKRLQRTGISMSLIDNLPHNAVVARAAEAQRSALS